MPKIKFKFEDNSIEERTLENLDIGISVLDACLENDIHLNHNCGGVNACSTCHVYVEEGGDDLPEITDREEDFIDRAINPTLESRLACQCHMEHKDVSLVVKIPDQSKIIGHEH